MTGKIEIKCEGTRFLAVDSLVDFQGSVKTLSEKNLEKLKRSVVSKGFIAPVFVWKSEGIEWILDGHQRVVACKSLEDEGWDVPELPVVDIKARTRQEAVKTLLVIASQYGEFDLVELAAFAHSYDILLSDVPMSIANADLDLDEATRSMEDFFDQLPVTEKDPKTIVCPLCGREFVDNGGKKISKGEV